MEISSGQPAIQVGGGSNGFLGGGDGGIVLLAFLAMMGGLGGWGGNRGPAFPVTGDQAPVSSAQFQSSQNMQNLADQNRDINNNVNNARHDLASNIYDKYNELQRDIASNAVTLANMQAQSQMCCCEIKQDIAAQTLKFSEMMNAQNMLMVGENQKTRDMFTQDKFERMQAEINDLKRNQDLSALRDQLLAARPPLLPPIPMAASL